MPKDTSQKPTRILKADLHIHTAHSGDSDISAWDIIESARANGLDVVGVTDHDTTRGALETKELAAKEFPELLVLVGQEVRTKSGELIVFGVMEDLPKKETLEQTMERARKLGGFIIVPHPYDLIREGIGKKMKGVLKYIDAVEVLNSKSIWKRFNKKAREFAEEHGLPMVAGSDAHIPQYIGSCYTLIETASDKPAENDIYLAIKRGGTVCSGDVVGLKGMDFSANFRKLRKKLRIPV
jgi:predicted metal-dependent phosphoesterase TrpH